MSDINLNKINHNSPLPFFVSAGVETDNNSQIKCEELLRIIPGKRIVCRGKWGDKTVVIKLFLNQSALRSNALKEKELVETLQKKEIITPAILYSGELENNNAAILVFENIENAKDAGDAWHSSSAQDKEKLLSQFMKVLAQHHETGLSQQDMHLSNFMLSDEKLYTLDTADILVSSIPLNRETSIDNLALLFSLLGTSFNQLILNAFDEYIKIRKWDKSEPDKQKLLTKINRLRNTKKDKYLKKIFRECSEFVCKKSFWKYYVYSRQYDNDKLRELINNPDNLIYYSELSTSSRSNNLFGILFSLFKQSYAKKLWMNAHLLKLNGTSTPAPVAFIENRFGPFCLKSYFVEEDIVERGPDS